MATLTSCAGTQPYDARAPFPAAAATISCDGIIYRRLTGERLRRAVIGARFARSSENPGHCARPTEAIVITSPDGQSFFPDGSTYAREADRIGAVRGTYEVRRDRFCTSLGGEPVCRMLYESSAGQYLQRYVLPGRQGAAPVIVGRFQEPGSR